MVIVHVHSLQSNPYLLCQFSLRLHLISHVSSSKILLYLSKKFGSHVKFGHHGKSRRISHIILTDKSLREELSSFCPELAYSISIITQIIMAMDNSCCVFFYINLGVAYACL